MGSKRIVILLTVLTVVLLGGGVFVLSNSLNSSQITTSQNAKAEVALKTYDWGEIDYDKGNVSKTFTIKNSGTDTLKLTKIKTSCTCTQAQVIINGQSSPYFSMHAVSGWVGEVLPGKEAQLSIIFDPQFHGPSGVGPMTRLISVETNDAQNPVLEFTLTGNVIKK